MLEQAHLEGTSTDTDFSSLSINCLILLLMSMELGIRLTKNYVPFIMPLQVNRFMP